MLEKRVPGGASMALLVTTAALVMTLDGTTGKVWK
jgi:hypothetical protein